jgi:hypothetical protein
LKLAGLLECWDKWIKVNYAESQRLSYERRKHHALHITRLIEEGEKRPLRKRRQAVTRSECV